MGNIFLNHKNNDLPIEINKYIDIWTKYLPYDQKALVVNLAVLCYNAKTKEDIFYVIDEYIKLRNHVVLCVYGTKLWNKLIGWGLPSEKVCRLVYDTWTKFPNSRIVDFGAGSGIFTFMFNQIGIPKNNLIAIDLVNPTYSDKSQRIFWNIDRTDSYNINQHDILFISWGTEMEFIVDQYISKGGICVIILGELDSGCTFPSDYIINSGYNSEFNTEIHHVVGLYSIYQEHISVNIPKKSQIYNNKKVI